MFGFDLHSDYLLSQLGFLLMLTVGLFNNSYRDYKARKAGVLKPLEVAAILRKMEENHDAHEAFWEQYNNFVGRGYKAPLGFLSIMAQLNDLQQQRSKGRYYFYHPTSGFMTVIPVEHIQTDQ